MAYRDDSEDVLEAPTSEGTLRIEVAPRAVKVVIGSRTLHVVEKVATVLEQRGKKAKRASFKIEHLVIARDVPHEDLGVWVELPGGLRILQRLEAANYDVFRHRPQLHTGDWSRIAWRALVLASRPSDEILATLQQVLVHERHREHIFATVCTLTISPDRRTASMHLVGHPAPLLVGETVRLLSEARVVPPLGVVTRTSWPATEVELPADWALLLHTDGLIDGRVGLGPERLGGEGLAELVQRQVRRDPAWRSAPEPFVDSLIQQAEALNGGDLVDDVAVLLVGALPAVSLTDD